MIAQAVFQILVAYGMLEDTQLQQHIDDIKSDFTDGNKTKQQIFGELNLNLRFIGMEVKSVRLKAEDGRWIYYHGVVNNDDDTVAKQHGSEFDPSEIKYYLEILHELVKQKSLSTSDICGVKGKPEKWSNSKVTNFLQRLKTLGWLTTNDAACWEIGVKTYLEMNAYLRDLLASSQLVDQIDDLVPQVIIY